MNSLENNFQINYDGKQVHIGGGGDGTDSLQLFIIRKYNFYLNQDLICNTKTTFANNCFLFDYFLEMMTYHI